MPHELLYVFFGLQFHYAVFFAYIRLREQEIRNLRREAANYRTQYNSVKDAAVKTELAKLVKRREVTKEKQMKAFGKMFA